MRRSCASPHLFANHKSLVEQLRRCPLSLIAVWWWALFRAGIKTGFAVVPLVVGRLRGPKWRGISMAKQEVFVVLVSSEIRCLTFTLEVSEIRVDDWRWLSYHDEKTFESRCKYRTGFTLNREVRENNNFHSKVRKNSNFPPKTVRKIISTKT